MSDRARNAPLLHFNYRDTRKFMAQNTKGITTNDSNAQGFMPGGAALTHDVFEIILLEFCPFFCEGCMKEKDERAYFARSLSFIS